MYRLLLPVLRVPGFQELFIYLQYIYCIWLKDGIDPISPDGKGVKETNLKILCRPARIGILLGFAGVCSRGTETVCVFTGVFSGEELGQGLVIPDR